MTKRVTRQQRQLIGRAAQAVSQRPLPKIERVRPYYQPGNDIGKIKADIAPGQTGTVIWQNQDGDTSVEQDKIRNPHSVTLDTNMRVRVEDWAGWNELCAVPCEFLECDESSPFVEDPGDPEWNLSAGDFALVDTNLGNRTVRLPVPVDGDVVGIKVVGDGVNYAQMLPNAPPTTIEPLAAGLPPGASAFAYATGETATWQYYETGDVWVVTTAAKGTPYIELWSGTPIIGMAGQTIQWTFVPVSPWQSSPVIATHAAGVFTFQIEASVSIDVNAEFTAQLSGTNSDVSYDITPQYTGTGSLYLRRMIDAFAHSRAGPFPQDKSKSGGVNPVINDTLSLVANATGAGGSTADLDQIDLIFTVD